MATYIRLTDYKSSDEKEQEFFNPENRYEAKQADFIQVGGVPIAYWVSKQVRQIFKNSKKLSAYADAKQGMATSDNDRFRRNWQEINFNSVANISTENKKWFPYNSGGEFRRWYGNQYYVINWENDGTEIKNFPKSVIRSPQFYLQSSVSWSKVSGDLALRYFPKNFIFDVAGCSIFSKTNIDNYIMAALNSSLKEPLIKSISPTINFEVGQLSNFPIIFPKSDEIRQQIETLTQQNIDISKEEWDSREISWDFIKNELIKHKTGTKIETAYSNYCNYWKEQFNTLHQNEEELNRLFIDIYELQDELTPDVELKDITILKNEAKIVDNELVFQADEIMKQFISYGVGVMFGRYSLDSDGLLIANMGQEVPTSTTFEIDDGNVIPVLEDDYFTDDIASRFVQFVKATFGEEDLSENIRFIESSLGTTLRKYFIKGFYEDHIKRYKKRPIYWMVASHKKGFMSLIYMHRYEADTFGRVRNSYLTEYIAKLEAHKETLTLTTSSDTASDRDKKDADKQMKNIDTKLKEIIEFDRDKMMHWSQNPTQIDLDDGVKVNYCKFKDILYPIAGLCK